ncbi:hypothetical protein KKC04_00615 [Patescibacteria group bacterium]|nr:hypothetical protein [Patescibacteria group bacterium]
MTLKAYLIIMGIATLCCWAAFGFILRTVNPEVTNTIGFLLFYLSLFLAVSGSAAIIGFVVRFIGLKRELVFNSVKQAFRQSFLFAFLIISALFLLSKGLFSWLNLLLLIAGLSMLEFFLISHSKYNANTTN